MRPWGQFAGQEQLHESNTMTSQMKSTLDKLHAILRRDLLTAIRHRSGFVVTLVGVFTELAAFYFLSRAIGPGFRPDGVEYFPFLLVGTGVYTFFVMSAQAFLSAVQEAQQTGTLEVLMTTSTAPAELVILSSISAFAGNLVNLLVYVFAGVAVFRASIHANFFSCVGSIDFFSGDRPRFGNRRGHAAGCVPERLGSAVAARFRTLVSERNSVPHRELAPPTRTSRSSASSHLRHRRNAPGAPRGAIPDGDGSHTGRAGRLRRGAAAARSRWSVAKFAPRAAEWNFIILLRILIPALPLGIAAN